MTELERLRREAGLTQTELAKEAGVGLSAVVKLEAGRDVRPEVARRLGRYFGKPWPVFYADSGFIGNTDPTDAKAI